MNTYKRPPIVFTRGRGCRVYDSSGREYLDFLAGIAVNALGHAHPRLVRMIRREAGRAIHTSNLFHNPFQGPLAKKLAKWSGLDRVFFTNSGTEATTELAPARAYANAKASVGGGGNSSVAKKTRILALENSFHGRTFGAVSITYPAKYREPFAPLVPGTEFVKFNDVADLERKFDDSVCALVVETIQGEGGIFPVTVVSAARARPRYAARCCVDRRRDSMWPWPDRPILCVSGAWLASRCGRCGEAFGRRIATGRFLSPTRNLRQLLLQECTVLHSVAARLFALQRLNFSR